ncbi:STAS domain-containing protein [Nocardia jejuensis]|uniref:STAS domain-containing protein n=1 Tax=Nocardia jejuensis TaxID=328049 RepID=UPI000830B073|nr:STAS domain-containing protein [Nocardia jejuensis]
MANNTSVSGRAHIVLPLDTQKIAADVLVRVGGELDLPTVAALDAGLRAAQNLTVPGGRLLVDLSDATFLGVTSMNALEAAYRRCAAIGVALSLRGVCASIARHLAAAGLGHLAPDPLRAG